MPKRPDPHIRPGNALKALIGGEIMESRQTAWASATFSGARHHYVLGISGHAQPNALDNLAEVEFDLPGHIVADIALSERHRQQDVQRITIEALTVEDA